MALGDTFLNGTSEAAGRRVGRPVAHTADKIEYWRLLKGEGGQPRPDRDQNRYPEDIPAPISVPGANRDGALHRMRLPADRRGPSLREL